MTHYTEETLIELLQQDHPQDEHASACAECREKLDSFRLVAGALRDETTWDELPLGEAPVPETITNLRAFADRMAAEDAQAALYLPDLLSGSRELWMNNLRRHPECRTAGVVRKLIESVPAALDSMPRDAVELTNLATEIADHLESATPQLRGAAWRERAYALFYTGDFAAAERALCASESHFTESSVNEYDLARVGIVRALVERGLEKYSSAIAHARASASQFAVYEDAKKSAGAHLAEAHLLMSCQEYDRAYESLTALKNNLFFADDPDTYGRVLGTLGFCSWKTGRIDEALHCLDGAAQLFEELGVHSEAVRARWNAARALAGEGRLADAMPRLRAVARELERLGMMLAATEAALEVAELLVTSGDYAEVEEICRKAMKHFQESSMAYTASALTALALIQEAARNRTATRLLVHQVREYLRRVPAEPNLLFAFPA